MQGCRRLRHLHFRVSAKTLRAFRSNERAGFCAPAGDRRKQMRTMLDLYGVVSGHGHRGGKKEAPKERSIKMEQRLAAGTHFVMGNIAFAEGAIAAGCNFASGYPITPASEILHDARTKTDAAKTALIYDNREQARGLLDEAKRMGFARSGAVEPDSHARQRLEQHRYGHYQP